MRVCSSVRQANSLRFVAKLLEVTKLLDSLKRDLQEKQLTSARKSKGPRTRMRSCTNTTSRCQNEFKLSFSCASTAQTLSTPDRSTAAMYDDYIDLVWTDL
jgi:hypothetical protein